MSLIHDYRRAAKEEKEKGRREHELFITMNIYDLIDFRQRGNYFYIRRLR